MRRALATASILTGLALAGVTDINIYDAARGRGTAIAITVIDFEFGYNGADFYNCTWMDC
jgi:hypothetical protein